MRKILCARARMSSFRARARATHAANFSDRSARFSISRRSRIALSPELLNIFEASEALDGFITRAFIRAVQIKIYVSVDLLSRNFLLG